MKYLDEIYLKNRKMILVKLNKQIQINHNLFIFAIPI